MATTTATRRRETPPDPVLLTRDELCARLRVGLDAEAFYRLRGDDPLPHLRIGRRILYELGSVIAWARREAERARRPTARSGARAARGATRRR